MRNKCKYFDGCSAPLCPQDVESLEFGLWYPDEETCRRQPLPAWIKVQRKIARKTDKTDLYFTFKMLNHDCIISVIGIDPDKTREVEEKKWLQKHKIRNKLSPEEKQKRVKNMNTAHQKKRAITDDSMSKTVNPSSLAVIQNKIDTLIPTQD